MSIKKKTSEKKIYPTGNLFAIYQNNEINIDTIKKSIDNISTPKIKELAIGIFDSIKLAQTNHETMRKLSKEGTEIHAKTLKIFEDICKKADNQGLLDFFRKVILSHFEIWDFDKLNKKQLFYDTIINYFKDPNINRTTSRMIKEFETVHDVKVLDYTEELVKNEILFKEIDYDCPKCINGGHMISDNNPNSLVCTECGTTLKTNHPDAQSLISGIYYHRGKNFEQLKLMKDKV